MGRSISTGPGRPLRMTWNACWNTMGTSAGSRTQTDHLVTPLLIVSISTAWKSSLCIRARGAWPVTHRIGTESAHAE